MRFFDQVRVMSAIRKLKVPTKREEAIETLVRIGEPAVEPLLDTLEHRNP